MKQAGQKHVFMLPRLNRPPAGPDAEGDTLQDLLDQMQCVCHCGAAFQSTKALRLHRVQMHGWRNVEHGLIHSTTCVVCLRQYWTSNRLQFHLRYASRPGRLNRCGAWIREFGLAEAHREDLPADNLVALPGTTRKDAVPLVPLVLGACATWRVSS